MILGLHHHRHLRARIPGASQLLPLRLEKISTEKIRHGGYKIRFHGHLPPGCTVRLLLGNNDHYSMDITGGFYHGTKTHTVNHLSELLDLIDRAGHWGKTVHVRVAAYLRGHLVAETLSNAQLLHAPVQPLKKIGVEEIGGVPDLRYTGALDGSGGGAYLCSPIDSKYFFAYGGMLETDKTRRGFDCTTYAGSALGLFNGRGMGVDGKTLAEELNAVPCEMENKGANDVKEFMNQHADGSYIMWSHGHVVVVKDGFVHEFTNRISVEKGYCKTEIGVWLETGKHKHQEFWMRELPR